MRRSRRKHPFTGSITNRRRRTGVLQTSLHRSRHAARAVAAPRSRDVFTSTVTAPGVCLLLCSSPASTDRVPCRAISVEKQNFHFANRMARFNLKPCCLCIQASPSVDKPDSGFITHSQSQQGFLGHQLYLDRQPQNRRSTVLICTAILVLSGVRRRL
jgi:hypothetical protein